MDESSYILIVSTYIDMCKEHLTKNILKKKLNNI